MASSEGTIFCGKHNAIIAACNEIDRRGLACLIRSHRRHSGEGLPIGPELCSVFYRRTMIQCLVVEHKMCSTHTSSGELSESSRGRVEGFGGRGWGVSVPPDEVSLHCRNCADCAAATDGRTDWPCPFSELSEVQEPGVWQWRSLPTVGAAAKANSPASVPLERSCGELFANVLRSKYRHRGRWNVLQSFLFESQLKTVV